MAYSQWRVSHTAKLTNLIESLPPMSLEELIQYFQYSNMSTSHPDFCGLYKGVIRCHSNPKLNCLFCACPHFVCSDEPLSTTPDGIKTFSVCSIGSSKAKPFVIDPSCHCDCSDCFLPHSRGHMDVLLKDVHSVSELISYLRRSNVI